MLAGKFILVSFSHSKGHLSGQKPLCTQKHIEGSENMLLNDPVNPMWRIAIGGKTCSIIQEQIGTQRPQGTAKTGGLDLTKRGYCNAKYEQRNIDHHQPNTNLASPGKRFSVRVCLYLVGLSYVSGNQHTYFNQNVETYPLWVVPFSMQGILNCMKLACIHSLFLCF